jgi:hypothetical protein
LSATEPRDIVKRIKREAKRRDLDFLPDHEGGNHTLYDLDGTMIPIPRHREIGEGLTRADLPRVPGQAGKGLVAEVSTYTAKATRDGKFWLIHVPEVERYTQARNVDEIETMARDLVAVMRGVEPDSFTLTVEIELPASVRAHLSAVEGARAEEAAARTRAAEELRAAAAELKDSHITVRDLGKLLGISHQRASQLTSKGTARPARERLTG